MTAIKGQSLEKRDDVFFLEYYIVFNVDIFIALLFTTVLMMQYCLLYFEQHVSRQMLVNFFVGNFVINCVLTLSG
jgi:hypothetical protein